MKRVALPAITKKRLEKIAFSVIKMFIIKFLKQK